MVDGVEARVISFHHLPFRRTFGSGFVCWVGWCRYVLDLGSDLYCRRCGGSWIQRKIDPQSIDCDMIRSSVDVSAVLV